jgi:GNAT superfamily N-acetyltransferase
LRNLVPKLLALYQRKKTVDVLKRIQILRASDNQMVDAEIVRLTADEARERIDKIWWKIPDVSAEDMNDEGDFHWDWERLTRIYGNKILHECIAVLSQEDYLEGSMIYHFNAKSKLELNKGSVYVERVSSAPRNRNWLVNEPFYKGIGTVLLYWAVRESYNAGLRGRVSLESLPTSNTVQFYERKGFVRTDLSQLTNGLVDYELPETAALVWLQKQGDLP